jgi:hypothetical protein
MKRPSLWFSSLTIFVAALLNGCAASFPSIPVVGTLAQQRLHTNVDAPVARYYLVRGDADAPANANWDASFDAIHTGLADRLPSAAQLRDWSQLYSPDLASLVLARQLYAQAQKQPLYKLFQEELLAISHASNGEGENELRHFTLDPDFLIAFVPGWLYKSDTKTGADFAGFRTLLASHGARVRLLETGENQSVEENAQVIEKQLSQLATTNQKIILVSGSKGGPEVALALSNMGDTAAGRNVKAWLNIGGLLNGTRLTDIGLSWPMCWVVSMTVLPDGSFEGIRSLDSARSVARAHLLNVPQHTLIVNYVGIPLSGQVSDQARGGYSILRSDGPNDGLTYLTDAMAPNGVTIPELGVDHFFRRPDMELRSLALARAISRMLRSGTS